MSLQVLRTPPSGRGRPTIAGTILWDGATQMVCVRRCLSLPRDCGGTGSPRCEVWIALRENDFAPIVVRGGTTDARLDWSRIFSKADCGLRLIDVEKSLARCGYKADDLWRAPRVDGSTWPVSIWDRRIVLPDDSRFPKNKKQTIGLAIEKMMLDRNACDDNNVWHLDARIMALAPKERMS